MNSHIEPTEGLSPFHHSEKIHLQYLLLGDGNVFFPGRADLGFVAAVPGAGTEYELHVGEVEQQNTHDNHCHQVTAYYLKSNGLFVNQRVH